MISTPVTFLTTEGIAVISTPVTFLVADPVRRPSDNDFLPDDEAAAYVTPCIFLLPVPVSGVSGVSALTGSGIRTAAVSGGTAAKSIPFVSLLPAPT